MSKAKQAANSDRTQNYPHEAGVELQSSVGEPSNALAYREGAGRNLPDTSRLLEAILEKDNLNQAYQRVRNNGGQHGVDGMGVNELLPYLRSHGEALRQSVLNGKYHPQPVRKVEIPKPDGGVRMLGIPTVVDRMLQQAITQVLSSMFEEEFSRHSYGFRPGRSAHQAIKQARDYINEGYRRVVDIDLEKFFDEVNHDKLMYLLSRRIADKRVLKLIRGYLKSGIMQDGLTSPSSKGTPQGGPLSPLLSNIMLHELDQELEKRGHRFCRYADDCNIYVKSRRSGARVMAGITRFIEEELKLKVNREKSAVSTSTRRKFLGFSFYYKQGKARISLHKASLARIKAKVKALTMRSNGKSIEHKIAKLTSLIKGWVNYYKIADMRKHCQRLDEWMRRRLRMCIWKHWKGIKTRFRNLKALGIDTYKAWEYANTRKGYWRTAISPILARTLTNHYFSSMGLIHFSEVYQH